MAVAFLTTPFLDGKIYAATLAGKRASMRLAMNTGSLGDTSSVAAWDAVQLSGNGYAAYEWTIPAGSFNNTTGRFQAPSQLCEFTASANGAGLTWNSVYIVLGTIANNVTTWETTAPSFLLSIGSNATLLAGSTPKSYALTLYADGFTLES
jgi:hypothetical protein